MPPTAGDTTLETSPNSAARIFSARARQSFSALSGYMKTRAFCRNTGDRRPEDRMKCPSRMAPHSRKTPRTSSLSNPLPPLAIAAPFQRSDGFGIGNGGALHRRKARATFERCQHIRQLGEVAHLDLEHHLVE